MTICQKQTRKGLDDILKEATEGYGDLMAASIVHQVSLKSLQSRLKELSWAEEAA